MNPGLCPECGSFGVEGCTQDCSLPYRISIEDLEIRLKAFGSAFYVIWEDLPPESRLALHIRIGGQRTMDEKHDNKPQEVRSPLPDTYVPGSLRVHLYGIGFRKDESGTKYEMTHSPIEDIRKLLETVPDADLPKPYILKLSDDGLHEWVYQWHSEGLWQKNPLYKGR